MFNDQLAGASYGNHQDKRHTAAARRSGYIWLWWWRVIDDVSGELIIKTHTCGWLAAPGCTSLRSTPHVIIQLSRGQLPRPPHTARFPRQSAATWASTPLYLLPRGAAPSTAQQPLETNNCSITTLLHLMSSGSLTNASSSSVNSLYAPPIRKQYLVGKTVFALAVMEYAVGVSKFGKNPMTL